MSVDCGQQRGSVERALNRDPLNIEGVDGECVVMSSLVIPRGERAVVPEVVPAHLRVTGEPFGVAVQSVTQPLADLGTGLPTWSYASAECALDQFGLVGRNVNENPVEEGAARQIVGHRSSLLIDVIGHGRCVGVVDDDGKGLRVVRGARPLQMWTEVAGESGVGLRIRLAHRVLGINLFVVGDAFTCQFHSVTLTTRMSRLGTNPCCGHLFALRWQERPPDGYGRWVPKYGDPIEVDVDGIPVRVSNPDKPLFADVGVTKREMVAYYVSVGPGILRALSDRPTTLERWPDGVRPGVELTQRMGPPKDAFFQKRIPKGAPDWVKTARITFPSGRHADEVCPDSVAVVAWAANLGTITFHPWPVRGDDVDHPDELRIDLDPQPGTDFKDAVRVAGLAQELMAELGYRGFPKTSGGRGLHIYLRVERRWDFIDMRHAAIAFGRELERRAPDLVTTKWWKEERGEKVFVDYNQNARDRTIASAYSVRPRPGAPVSTPVLWEELPDVAPGDFTVRTVPERFARIGDLQAEIDDQSFDLAPLIEMYERDERDRGLGEMPYPPDYPKMAGEPMRVQPSRRAK